MTTTTFLPVASTALNSSDCAPGKCRKSRSVPSPSWQSPPSASTTVSTAAAAATTFGMPLVLTAQASETALLVVVELAPLMSAMCDQRGAIVAAEPW